ncbi:hypothetical protein PK98_03175 [Croceibacterium mercuriale]|uniref:Urease-associated protein n=1 Tax=Croceibacterium mercuriale TaxID=1572751 RepID=A0A0B2BYM9_9SPHN|nr:hypothetical protein PK98_03175 [Croceibacterium mercuriale]
MRRTRLAALAVAATVALFALMAGIGSSIPRNAGWQAPAHGVTIMVETNGVHTALVLPLVSEQVDWRRVFPVQHVAAAGRPYTHLAISWGEREVFLNTPTWWDLRPGTVARIAGLGGDGLLHVAHYVRPAPSAQLRPLVLRPEEYRRLVAAIGRSLPPPEARHYPGYGAQDVFYDAPGRYTVRNTCNQWTSDMLAAAGVRIGWWTPAAGGVMKWVPETPDGNS